ncbi:hypothetical protein AM493_18430 [Flavobacterium akiainvivens]|uniref:Lipocalin-like domain-containing protein n=1 Tax=Flavobacterium akiainvivens TaxID=1202724 RepID=A0A0M8ML68_9FLAO|nr:hypothetical protein [Flavobacterium akiainvivens]KOS07808.1 hypothetical protein AM493_18430 [Flavobacterium akiainvivens]SFQ26787.1 hypothetical protein SAMN05444144_102268 [Flavobacterium akiainvivens]
MSKLLLLFVAITGLTAHAQTITQQTLEGKWNVVFMETEGIGIDFEKKTVAMDPKMKEELGAEYVAAVEGQLKEMIDSGAGFSVTFKGAEAVFSQSMGGETKDDKATYELKAGTPLLMVVTMDGGESRVQEVTLKDGKLEMTGQESRDKMVLKKA